MRLHQSVPRASMSHIVRSLTLPTGPVPVPSIALLFPAVAGRVLVWHVSFGGLDARSGKDLPDLSLDAWSARMLPLGYAEPGLGEAVEAVWGGGSDPACLSRLLSLVMSTIVVRTGEWVIQSLEGNVGLVADVEMVVGECGKGRGNGGEEEGEEEGRGLGYDIGVFPAGGEGRPRAWGSVACEKRRVCGEREKMLASWVDREGVLPVTQQQEGVVGGGGEGSSGEESGVWGGEVFQAGWVVLHVPLEFDLSPYVSENEVERAAGELEKNPKLHSVRVRMVYELDNSGLTTKNISATLLVSDFWADALSAITLPLRSKECSLADYLPRVGEALVEQLPYLAQSRVLRRGVVEGLLEDPELALALIEADLSNYLKISFVVRSSRQSVLATISLPPVFPQSRPSFLLSALGHIHPPPAVGPISRIYDSYTYSPDWDCGTMVGNIKTHLLSSAAAFVNSLA